MIQITNTSMTRKVKSFYTIHHIILKHKNHQHKVYVCDIEIVKFTTKLSLVTNFVCSQWLTVTCANTYLVEQTHYSNNTGVVNNLFQVAETVILAQK